MTKYYESERLYFREFSQKDFESCHEYGQNPIVSKYQSWGPNKEQDTKDFLSAVIDYQNEVPRRSFEFAVIDSQTNKHIGGAGIRMKSTPHNEADMGYSLNPKVWGKGYGTEVAKGILNFGFNILELNRIWAQVHVDNLASVRVLEKAGFRREGTQREGLFIRGQYCDCYLYATIKSDHSDT